MHVTSTQIKKKNFVLKNAYSLLKKHYVTLSDAPFVFYLNFTEAPPEENCELKV